MFINPICMGFEVSEPSNQIWGIKSYDLAYKLHQTVGYELKNDLRFVDFEILPFVIYELVMSKVRSAEASLSWRMTPLDFVNMSSCGFVL
jgi:hypothetical protein